MAKGKKRIVEPFLENAAEATTACLLAMVQGNLLAISLGHWLIASQTGLAAGAATAAAGGVRRWISATLRF
ncbi:MAG: hypothetical protein AB7I04_08690 [Pseudomonadales bacterium]